MTRRTKEERERLATIEAKLPAIKAAIESLAGAANKKKARLEPNQDSCGHQPYPKMVATRRSKAWTAQAGVEV